MIVVNFATGHYKKGQERLKASLGNHKALMLDSYTAIGSPTHSESPYEFKIHSILAARQFDPVVLWADASMWRVGNLKTIEDLILKDGYFMSEAGHYVGRWTNKHTRDYFNLTESEARQETGGFIMFSAGLLGLDFRTEIANEFFDQWQAAALAGCFCGDWNDHRHDMTCASIIACRLRMKFQRGGQHMSYLGPGYSTPENDSIFYLQGI